MAKAREGLPVERPTREPRIAADLREVGVAVELFPRYVNRELRLHMVDCVLVSFILRGRGTHVLGDDAHPETGGSLGITHYGQAHDILTDAEGMEVINLYLDPERHPLPALPRELEPVLARILPPHPAFRHRLNGMVRLQFADPAPAAGALLAMERELRLRPPGFRDAVRHHFSLFLIACCRQALESGLAPVDGGTLAPAGDAVLERVRRRLEQDLAAELSLPALAREAGLSPGGLCRAFKRHTGMSPGDYRNRRRVHEAMRRLRSGREKVLAVALACGFRDQAWFNRLFRRLAGTTPRAYRSAGLAPGRLP